MRALKPTLSHCGSFVLALVALHLCWLLFGAGCSAPSAAPSPSGNDTLTVAFYNVENLFDLVANGSEYPTYRPFAAGWDTYSFGVKLHNTVEVIDALSADIVGLCEVENRHVLEQLIEELARCGQSYPYHAVADTPSGTSTVTVLLSRIPIFNVRSIPTVRTGRYWSRSILEGSVAIDKDTLTFFVNHWPSKHQSESYRVAAARALAARLDQLPVQHDYLVLGDFNENKDEMETFTTEGFDDTFGETALQHVLGTALSRPLECPVYRRAGERGGLFDAWFAPGLEQAGSHFFNGRLQTPDHVLVPHPLFDTIGFSWVCGGVEPFTMGGKLLVNGRPFRWQMRQGKQGRVHEGRGYSDHLPLICRLVRSRTQSGCTIDTRPLTTESGKCSHVPDLESGWDGWVGMDNGVALERKGSGRGWVLSIKGTPRSNATVARIRIPAYRFANPVARSVTLHLQGSGAICVRIRPVGTKGWKYWDVRTNVLSGRATYVQNSFAQWEKPMVRVPWDSRQMSAGLDLEIRGAGGVPVNLVVDSCVVQ